MAEMEQMHVLDGLSQFLCSDEENVVVSDDEIEVRADNECTSEASEIVPTVGMKFRDYNEIFEFYKTYAYNVGFPVRKRNSKKNDDGSLKYVTFACSREGRRTSDTSSSLKPQPTIKSGCLARLTAATDVMGTWRVTKVILEHNHKLSPSKSRLYRCNRQLTEQVKRKLEVNDIASIPMHKSYNSAVVEADGYENLLFVKNDCRNYIDKVRRLRLGEGDAAAIQAYFSKMQAQCPGFFFSVDLDDECRLKNVFWVDNRCRQAYKEFGDVVTFDTTYLTNKYDTPFVLFVGVNHHGHLTLLGCGLVSSEDTKTFVWLFRTWLECMEGQAPIGIITDQDRAMQNAIQIVFPNTRHRWCLWHILKKLPEKFGGYAHKSSILSAIHEVVYESQSPEEFERGWSLLIDMYTLHDNDWLSELFRERGRWVPCFLRTSFWAGMSTTQRSESMNAFFDGYVNSKTSLKLFVEQYERALRCKVENEFQADFKSYSQMVPCATRYCMEKQFQEVYTISKFKEFQEELTGKMYCDIISTEVGYLGTRYEVQEDIIFNETTKRKRFTVMFEGEKCHIVCSCHLFEFQGILCKHALSVLIRNDVKLIPDSYILRRWRKDVRRAYTRVKINYNGWVNTPEQVRYDQLQSLFANVANLVVDDKERTRELMELLENQMNDLTISRLRTTCGSNLLSQGSVQSASDCGKVARTSSGLILDPHCTKTKGALRKLHQKGPMETSTKKHKSSKGKRPMENNAQPGQVLIQAAQEGAHYQPWNAVYGVNWVPTYQVSQPLMPTYVPHRRPEEDEVRIELMNTGLLKERPP
ncbi:protein FAR1-RELATED SEQUENCE 4-like isoform X2 [Diospyros lotus]|uniref:protein FAR1-RELATED SEQUENCE 4-like isoform X2 n=1 Tax=Diospyros lotus TaxID=55363 RepID=UPI0022566C47|nr:protein FAR1-RELATED SEQUENCE 4-like isoform X2 [Diospyros lotus]